MCKLARELLPLTLLVLHLLPLVLQVCHGLAEIGLNLEFLENDLKLRLNFLEPHSLLFLLGLELSLCFQEYVYKQIGSEAGRNSEKEYQQAIISGGALCRSSF
jgi:hypothetical protein